ncbi:MAG TPA: alpha/beta hydrolase [Thermomicrobiaceae bacterium]|nr:alpha/beta hydrolase [Thermomicrobiaceae bacterium]
MLATAPDGAHIAYHVYDFTDPWSEPNTIFLHHGLRMNHCLWYDWIPLLARRYRTVLIDARGRGESTIPEPGFAYSMEQFATDALAVMDAAGAGARERFHWLGTSFGSAIGEYVGARYGDRLETLILTSPPYRFTQVRDVVEGWVADYDRLGSRAFLERDVRNMFPADADPRLMDWHAQQMDLVPPHVAKDMLRFMATVNLADLLPDIHVPTLILAAKQSDRAPSTEAEFMASRIPDCELVVFDSHHNITSIMPEQCVAAVLDFLGRHAGR